MKQQMEDIWKRTDSSFCMSETSVDTERRKVDHRSTTPLFQLYNADLRFHIKWAEQESDWNEAAVT
jgi:hypothetical protein